MKKMLIVFGLILTYLIVWITDSIWEYVPEVKSSTTEQIVSTPTPTPTPRCQIFWNAVGDAESSCEPTYVENPGWEGR